MIGSMAGLAGGLALLGASALAGDGDRRDVHSFSRPDQVRVGHLSLSLGVDFDRNKLQGSATWAVERQPGTPADAPLILDTRGLKVVQVRAGVGTRPDLMRIVPFELGPADPILGAPLTIPLPEGAEFVQVYYQTGPDAGALQWVNPSGTAGKQLPFLFTQSQAIQARSWIPCQDTPGVRITYDASVHVPHRTPIGDPSIFRAVMAAEDVTASRAGRGRVPGGVIYSFRMTRPIPSYLIALAVGDLEFREIGPRTGVWAEPSVAEAAAKEFEDAEKMLEAAERLFGPYRWDRYDILVLPPSFPFGGMENPRLTFATPTVLAGDKSQVALIAHELAHSWSGNLVTNATWRDFWLNEGFTVYLERRIVEEVFGPDRAAMERVLGLGELRDELAKLPPADTVLHIDLTGRDPDDGMTRIPYEKGALFLTALEEKVGRDRITAFLRGYFDHFAFRSITTADFESYLKEQLFTAGEVPLDLDAWFRRPGLPEGAPEPSSDRFAAIERTAAGFAAGRVPAVQIDARGWSTLEWLHFLRSLPSKLDEQLLGELDDAFGLTRTGNAEVATRWFILATRSSFGPVEGPLADFLTRVGRRKFLLPLYETLTEMPGGRERAREIFQRARPGYHPIAAESVARLLGEG